MAATDGSTLSEQDTLTIFALRSRATCGEKADNQFAAGRSAVVCEMFGVDAKLVRDIWARKVFAEVTEPYWTEREKLLHACDEIKEQRKQDTVPPASSSVAADNSIAAYYDNSAQGGPQYAPEQYMQGAPSYADPYACQYDNAYYQPRQQPFVAPPLVPANSHSSSSMSMLADATAAFGLGAQAAPDASQQHMPPHMHFTGQSQNTTTADSSSPLPAVGGHAQRKHSLQGRSGRGAHSIGYRRRHSMGTPAGGSGSLSPAQQPQQVGGPAGGEGGEGGGDAWRFKWRHHSVTSLDSYGDSDCDETASQNGSKRNLLALIQDSPLAPPPINPSKRASISGPSDPASSDPFGEGEDAFAALPGLDDDLFKFNSREEAGGLSVEFARMLSAVSEGYSERAASSEVPDALSLKSDGRMLMRGQGGVEMPLRLPSDEPSYTAPSFSPPPMRA